jgi:hypothetical protein
MGNSFLTKRPRVTTDSGESLSFAESEQRGAKAAISVAALLQALLGLGNVTLDFNAYSVRHSDDDWL